MSNNLNNVSLTNLLLYFLRLGGFGFGGPIALAGYMQNDLVENRKWITQSQYNEGLAFSQVSPGPLAAQLAMYIGWLHSGISGASLVGLVFILPSFIMVVVLAACYLKFQNLIWIQSLFYTIGAAVIGIIAKSAYQLTRKTIGQDRLLWILFFISAAVTIQMETEIVWLFIAAGFIALIFKFPPKIFNRTSLFTLATPFALTSVLQSEVGEKTLLQLIIYFSKVGAIVFGSGLAIVPFLHGGVVQDFHWLNERQFLDSIAVGMITPGPIVITAGFIGFLVAGFMGSCAAAVGVFLPVYLFVIIGAPLYHRHISNPKLKVFVAGITAAAIGGIAGSVVILGKRAITDIPTVLIALSVLFILIKTKKIPEPILILITGIIGLMLKGI